MTMHLKDMTEYELSFIPCEICDMYRIDDEACITAMKDNEAVCVYCCGCCE